MKERRDSGHVLSMLSAVRLGGTVTFDVSCGEARMQPHAEPCDTCIANFNNVDGGDQTEMTLAAPVYLARVAGACH